MESVDDCDDALRLDSTLIKLHIRKGKCLLRMGHWNAVEAAFTRALELSINEFLPIVTPPMDADTQAAFEQTIDSVKMEAKAGLRDLEKLRNAVKELITAEANMEWEKVLKISDDILRKSLVNRAAQISKAGAFNELNRFEEAKSFMEEITSKAAVSIQSLYAHSKAILPCPNLVDLVWEETKNSGLRVNIIGIKNMILCMGHDLGYIYLISLKNIKANRNFSAEVMMKILALLGELDSTIDNEEKKETWQWVVKEFSRLKELIEMKNTADQQFKAKSFVSALQTYTASLKV
jgi:tetratricopeptide (TPR) repeat protein